MSIRNLDNSHDWTFGAGVNNYLSNNNLEIALNIKTRVLSFLGDCFFAVDEGIDWFNYLSNLNKQEELENAVTSVIAATPGVSAINSVDVLLGANRKITLSYNIQTIYSTSYTAEITPLHY